MIPFSDQPTIDDELGIAPYIDTISSIIDRIKPSETPLTIGIFGAWGSGKTSAMKMIERRIDLSSNISVWFDAWKYTHTESLWRAFLVSIIDSTYNQLINDRSSLEMIRLHHNNFHNANINSTDQLRDLMKSDMNDTISTLYRSVTRDKSDGIEIDWSVLGKSAIKTVIKVGFEQIPVIGAISKAVEKAKESLGDVDEIDKAMGAVKLKKSEVYKDHIQSLEQFHTKFRNIIRDWITCTNKKLVVFIDDLDRCLPEDSISVIESIKVFLDAKGCIFVIGADRNIVERGISLRYSKYPHLNTNSISQDYFDKLIQIPLDLPPLSRETTAMFTSSRLHMMSNMNQSDINSITSIVSEGMHRNPRKIKRLFNDLLIRHQIIKSSNLNISLPLLVKLMILQTTEPEIYNLISHDPLHIRVLENQNESTIRLLSDSARPKLSLTATIFACNPRFATVDDRMLRQMVHITSPSETTTD